MLKYSIVIFLCMLAFQEALLAQEIKNNYTITSPAGDFTPAHDKHAKIESTLTTLYTRFQKSSFRSANDSTQYVTIDAVAKNDTRQLLEDLQALGLEDGIAFGRIVSGRIPIRVIEELNLLESLLFARQALGASNVGEATSEGDISIQAPAVRTNFCVDGAGVKVGVISDSYNHLEGAAKGIASGDLPGKQNPDGYDIPVDVLNDVFSGEDEGRAMLEIVHDIAPGAALAFHTSLGGQSSFANGIRALTNAGCDIIIDDWKYFAEPFFQDGIIAQSIDEVTAKGVTYFAFAGNHARLSYEKKFKPKSITINGEKVVAHNFGKGDVFQQLIVPPGRTMTLSLQWKDRYASVKPSARGAATDLDIFLLDQFASRILSQNTSNNIGADPVALITYTNTTNSFQGVNVLITKFSGPSPELIKYVIFNQSNSAIIDEYNTMSPTIVGHSNAASAITVGAASFRNTPAFGKPRPVIESFSSAGGVPIFFDVDGNALTPIIRPKPEITAPDGGNTTFFGFDTDLDGFPNFSGTSASVPHAAGVAALMLEATKKQLTSAQIGQALQATAIKMDDPSTSGAGLIQADKVVAAIATHNNCNPYAAAVMQFELINTLANTSVQKLKEGDVIDLNEINNEPLSIRAITNPGKVGSVELKLEGPRSIRSTENAAPYTLFGNNTSIRGERLPTGLYTLTATPYAESNLQGEVGTAKTIHFEIVANYALVSLSLINAETGEEKGTLKEGDVVHLPSQKKVNIRAKPSVKMVGSVKFELAGPVSANQVENIVPYALFGDFPPAAYRGKRLPAGTYSLTATPYSGARAQGMKGTPLTISFEVIDDMSAVISREELHFQHHSEQVQGNFRVFPVPTSNTLNIIHENDASESFRVVLYDELTGRIVESRTIHKKRQAVLPLQQHPMGNYILKIISQEAAHTFKIFKQ